MAKQRYFSLSGQTYGADDFGKALTRRYREQTQENIDNLRDQIFNELRQLLSELNLNSSFRGRGEHGYKYDAPMGDSIIVIEPYRIPNGEGLVGYRIYVDNKVFNILDSGRPSIVTSASNPMKFPIYEGNLTRPDSLVVGSPVKILDAKRRLNSASFEDIDAKAGGWVVTNFVRPVKPRRFYANILKKVLSDLRPGSIINIRRREVDIDVDDD